MAVPLPERNTFCCPRTPERMAKSPVFHGVPLHSPQPAETKVLLMKNISVAVIGMVLLVSSLVCSMASMEQQSGVEASFCCSPPPVCSPEWPCATGLKADMKVASTSFCCHPAPVCSPERPCMTGLMADIKAAKASFCCVPPPVCSPEQPCTTGLER